jgi:thiosulfate/3-mercaptopyruvate sulfurtransferase
MTNLIDAGDLDGRLEDPRVRIVDARFDLADPDAGRRGYEQGHLPGAIYLHLEEDLSGPVAANGRGGRHPLPDPEALAARLGQNGIGDAHEVIAYDDAGGAFAARAWWLLRWLGHDDVRVLNGGLAAWRAHGGPLDDAPPDLAPARFTPRPDPTWVVDAGDVAAHIEDADRLLVDARAPERYRGEVEPIDPVAGHVPGAVNLPFAGNLDEDGRFLPRDALRARFAPLEGAGEVVVYCGSGVTAAHDVLAIEEAGFGLPKLYAGAWSDWCRRPALPVETGDPAANDGAGDEELD